MRSRSNIAPEYRTHVRKIGDKWRVDYHLPYSGHMWVSYNTWARAMREAWKIEDERQWM